MKTLLPLETKPKYDRCNKGHPLTQVYNEKTDTLKWDCLHCINAMSMAEQRIERCNVCGLMAQAENIPINYSCMCGE